MDDAFVTDECDGDPAKAIVRSFERSEFDGVDHCGFTWAFTWAGLRTVVMSTNCGIGFSPSWMACVVGGFVLMASCLCSLLTHDAGGFLLLFCCLGIA
jgi:hypothetical protein